METIIIIATLNLFRDLYRPNRESYNCFAMSKANCIPNFNFPCHL